MHRGSFALGMALLTMVGSVHAATAEGWKAGTAKVVITPTQPIWMAGYAARTKPSEGKLHDLWAKALAIQDPDGKTAVLVTLDVCGISRPLSNKIREAIEAKHRITRDRIALACSHTHSGPVLGTNLITMYPLDAEQKRRIESYSETFSAAVIALVDRAVSALEPAELSWGTGRADFAVNRRNNDQSKAAELRERIALKGPVDHDVPVLRIAAPGGALKAIICGYACHCTVLSGYELSGDYAAFAQIDIERAHPGALAMFVAGCGADQNPLPRGRVVQAMIYGHELAEAVERVLAGPLRSVSGRLGTAYTEIDLALGEIPGKPFWDAEARVENLARAGRARKLLTQLEAEGKLPDRYPYPIEVWRFGEDLTWILLGGEVVVDYASRIKANLGSSHTWVSAYCNDVMAYIPSLRVLKEGGYEGATAMIYYGLPAPWSERVEEQVIDAVREQVGRATESSASR